MMKRAILLTILLATGCSGGPTATNSALPIFSGAGSWIRHSSGSSALIYASLNSGSVLIYDFSGNEVGELDGLGETAGLCSDSSGDVFVVDAERSLIYEYPPAGSLPVYIYDDRGNRPVGCAVDPTSGDLAVTNLENVSVWPPGTSETPKSYLSSNITAYAYASYDDAGNLFVDGTSSKQGVAFAALYSGNQSFTAIPLGLGNRKHRAAGVQWDGQYVAVADSLTASIYRVAVSGTTGKIIQTVSVRGWLRHTPIEFAIVGKKLLLPLFDKLLFYKYPEGGKKTGGFLGNVGYNITVVQ